jgi:sugar/nucleoside kinase (ribokinase family)
MTDRGGAPDVVVVGAAARDIAPSDPRGWRLGGGVTYGALALARLGVRTGVIIGLDPQAMDAHELELLEAAGAQVVRVPLANGPVFNNEERPTGRVQTCLSTSDPVPVEALPPAWRVAPAWLLAPVASEVPDGWAEVPRASACVAFGWQGILRHLFPGERVWPIEPGPSPLLLRADLVGVSRHDLPHGLQMADVARWLGSPCELLITAGPQGGLLLRYLHGRVASGRIYAGVPAREEVDPTGAGDTMLAGVLAGRLAGGRSWLPGRALRIGALASSLLVEQPGLDSVPWLKSLQEREDSLHGRS